MSSEETTKPDISHIDPVIPVRHERPRGRRHRPLPRMRGTIGGFPRSPDALILRALHKEPGPTGMMTLREILARRSPVIARTKEGIVTRGYLEQGRYLNKGLVRMVDVEGKPVSLEMESLKAIFFVRDFSGDPNYMEEKALRSEPDRPGLRARLRFEDNETLEGVAENSLDTITPPGFFFWPADPKSNNLLIFVVTSALIGFRVLSMDSR